MALFSGPSIIKARQGNEELELSESRKHWVRFEGAASDGALLAMGRKSHLAQPPEVMAWDPDASEVGLRLALPGPRLPRPALLALGGALTLVLAGVAVFVPNLAVQPTAPEAVVVLLLLGLLALQAVFGAEMLAIGSVMAPGSRFVGISRGFLRAHPAAWRLNASVGAVLPFALALLVLELFGLCLRELHPLFGAAWGLGLFIGLLRALMPIEDGPLSRLLAYWGEIDELPRRLRWAVAGRFLPFGSSLEVRGGFVIALAALGLVLWIVASFGVLRLAGGHSPAGVAPFIWHGALGALTFLIQAALVLELWRLVEGARLMRARGKLTRHEGMSEEARVALKAHPLVSRIPSIADLAWCEASAERSTALIRRGTTEGDFYLLLEGHALIVGRSSEGDLDLFGVVGPGTGIGEVAFLGGGVRTADVLVMEPSKLLVLPGAEASRIGEAEKGVLRQVVAASQAFSHVSALRVLPPAVRAELLREGVPVPLVPGQMLIREGDEEDWVGLLLSGSLDVRRGERRVAVLAAGDLFGEMAWAGLGKRTSDVVALQEGLVWRWPGELLRKLGEEAGLADSLRKLAMERQS